MIQKNASRSRGFFLVILSTAFWATSGLFISLILAGSNLTPQQLAFWRDLGTFICLAIGLVVFRFDLLKINLRDLPWLAAMGAFSIGLFHVLWNTSIVTNGVSITPVFQSNAPIIVAVIAWLLWKEPLTWRKITAIGLAIIGTILISRLDGFGQWQITSFGLLVGVGLALTFASLSLFGKKLTGNYSPWTVLVYCFGFGALALLPFQIGSSAPWPVSLNVIGAFAGLVLFTTIGGFALYTSGLKELPASVAAIVSTTEIPFTAIVAYFFLGERLDGWQIFGAILVISGVVVLSLPRRIGKNSKATLSQINRVKRGESA